MKAHLAKLSLALLSTVFLLGCQGQGSEAVGPDGLGPEFNPPGSVSAEDCPVELQKDHCHGEGGDPRFTVTMEGDISSVEHVGVANNSSILNEQRSYGGLHFPAGAADLRRPHEAANSGP